MRIAPGHNLGRVALKWGDKATVETPGTILYNDAVLHEMPLSSQWDFRERSSGGPSSTVFPLYSVVFIPVKDGWDYCHNISFVKKRK